MVFIGKALYYGFFYLVLITIIVSFAITKKEKEEWFSRNAVKELKGIAILMVLMGHMTYTFGFFVMPVTPALGAPAVDLFLFLSAFGLMCSYEKNGLHNFFKKRLSTILIPYFFVTALKVPMMLLEQRTWSDILLNFSLFSVSADNSMWYIQYILLLYLLFWAVFKIPKWNEKRKVSLLLLIGIAITIVTGGLFYSNHLPQGIPVMESYSHHLSFPLGALFYLLYKKMNEFSSKRYVAIAILAFILFQFIAFPGIGGFLKYYANNLAYVFFFVALFALLKRAGKSSRLLSYLGELSYYIYLNELVMMQLLYSYGKLPNGFFAPVILVASVLIAIPCRYLCEKILKKLKMY